VGRLRNAEAHRALGRQSRHHARPRRPRRCAGVRQRADGHLKLPNEADSQWLSQGGRDSAAAYLLPRAEAALCHLVALDAVKPGALQRKHAREELAATNLAAEIAIARAKSLLLSIVDFERAYQSSCGLAEQAWRGIKRGCCG
jgi:hypothetical protein